MSNSHMDSDRPDLRWPTFTCLPYPLSLLPLPFRFFSKINSERNQSPRDAGLLLRNCPQELSAMEFQLPKLDESVSENSKKGWTRSSATECLLGTCKALGWPPAPCKPWKGRWRNGTSISFSPIPGILSVTPTYTALLDVSEVLLETFTNGCSVRQTAIRNITLRGAYVLPSTQESALSAPEHVA